jgi:signal transduction histidine kinase
MGFSQLLESDNTYPLTQAQTEWVSHIYKAGKLLMALISDVLDLSKIETGNVKLAMEEFSVNEIMLEALSLIESIATQNNIKIRTRIDPLATLYINADPLRFKQILINLLSNAIKYNSENGTIILSSKVANGRVKISIKDSGKGIDESKLIELFKPFNRLGAEKSGVEGTGIGLCIAKNLVERMGGEIGVRNNKEIGCCFWVEFPLVRQEKLFTESTDDIAKKLQTELAYLQESLNHIGLIKTPAQEAVIAR